MNVAPIHDILDKKVKLSQYIYGRQFIHLGWRFVIG